MKKILIVEDDISLNQALKDRFVLEKFDVSSAFNGEECLDFVKENLPDIILLDLVMPKMGGLETLGKLKSDESTKDIPILILTNLSDTDKVSEVLEKGAYDYFVKSDSSLDKIVEKVNDKLN